MAPVASATTATLVKIRKTSNWGHPSPDPTGIAYQGSTHRFIVVDSEVDETPLYHGVNVWVRGPKLGPKGIWNTLRFSHEPTDVAVRGRRTLFFTDDNKDRVFRLRPGPDGKWGTNDDAVSFFSTHPFGSRDPEGLAFGRVGKRLRRVVMFVADCRSSTLFRIAPGPNKRFDGVAPVGDDVVKKTYDTALLGISCPRGVYYNSRSRRLFLVGHTNPVIVRTTFGGVLVDTIDISGSGILHPSGITMAPGTNGDSKMHLFVTDKGVDNNPQPNENDGRIFEFVLTP